jgi:hypothetical protein
MRLDDATGGGFVLIGKSASLFGALPDEIKKQWAAIGRRCYALAGDDKSCAHLDDSDGDLGQWLIAKGASAVLLRPDFYVFSTAASAPEAAALVRDLIDKIAA